MAERNKRNQALNGLRGLASVAVVLYHSILFLNLSLVNTTLLAPIQNIASPREFGAKVLLSLFNGHLAVLIFFVLSGFVLSRSLERSIKDPISTAFEFLTRRLFRIYPAMIVCMVAFFLISLAVHSSGAELVGMPAPNIKTAIENALLTKIVWHGATWTIQAEIIAAPFILVFFFVGRCLGIVGLCLCFSYCLASLEAPALVFSLPNMPITLTAICAGMIASHPSCRPAIQSDDRFPSSLLFAANLALISLFPIGQNLTEISRIIVAALLVGTLGAGRGNRFLASVPLQFLGKVSFSLYLLNVPVILLLAPVATGLFSDNLIAGTILGVTTTLLTLPLAHLSEKYVEQLGIRGGNALIEIVSRGLLAIFKTLAPKSVNGSSIA